MLVSDDAGATFRELVRVAALSGVVVTGDGRLFVADAGDPAMPDLEAGLWHAPDLGAAPSRLPGSDRVLCLGYDAAKDVLYGCHAYTFGTLDVEDGSLQPLLDFRAVETFVACDGVDMAVACESQLRPAYCHVSHFPCAPVCAAYPLEPALIDAVACSERIDPMAAPVDAGAPAAAGAGSDPDLGSEDGGAPADEPEAMPPAPAPMTCSASAAGPGAAGRLAGVAALFLLAAVRVRRTSRRARRSTRAALG